MTSLSIDVNTVSDPDSAFELKKDPDLGDFTVKNINNKNSDQTVQFSGSKIASCYLLDL